MTTLQSINASASPEVQSNENFETLSAAGIFGKRQPVTTGLTWGYYGGRYNGNTIADGTVALTDTNTNYVVVKRSDGVVSAATTTTNWDNTTDYARLYQLTVAGGVVTATVDSRQDTGGLLSSSPGVGGLGTVTSVSITAPAAGITQSGSPITGSGSITLALADDLAVLESLTATTDNFIQSKSSTWASRTIAQVTVDLQGTGLIAGSVGFRLVPSNSRSAAYTTVATDSGGSVDHPSTDANARTFTIDSNANVAYPDGTCITFTNMTAQVVTIAITSDTMYLAGTGTTGSRSLAQYGIATARKQTSTTWLISGTGIT